jgi:transcription elongation factor GreA
MQLRETVRLTREAIKELKDELDHLRIVRRREVADMLNQSRENEGANTDDAPYDPARDEQAFVEGRIAELEQLLAHAEILEGGSKDGRVSLGSTVVVEDQRGKARTFRVVSSVETDPAEGKVSDASPIGKALLGASAGDKVTVKAPAGAQQLTVREVR